MKSKLTILVTTSLLLIGCAKDEQEPQDPQLNAYKQLDNYPGKTQLDGCPAQSANTLVLVIFGQSNSANSGEEKTTNEDDRIVNFYDGKCTVASDPLLGASGKGGNSFTMLAVKLLNTGKYDKIILVPLGVGGTRMSRWAHGGDLFFMFKDRMEQMKNTYIPTHFLWHQGESDSDTDYFYYLSGLKQLVDTAKTYSQTSKFYVSLVSGCEGVVGNQVRSAQASIVGYFGVLQGPDVDTYITLEERYDKCHYGSVGQNHFSNMYLDLFEAE